MLKASPVTPFIEAQGVLMLDGGLATQLEESGFKLDTHLWSASLLDTNPEAISQAHQAYLQAGADCIASVSYQASLDGFLSAGYSKQKAKILMQRPLELAKQARDKFVKQNTDTRRLPPLVAASIGPYGAVLADGAEYRGDYNISRADLKVFHESRWEIFQQGEPDLIACETIPSFTEAGVLLEIFQQSPDVSGWISFSCRDEAHISDGTRLSECAALLKDCEQVVAIGINCTAPKYIPELIEQVRLGAPDKPVVVYPNSGNIYDAEKHCWLDNPQPLDFVGAARDWYKRGARLIGGCCQTDPAHIKAMREALLE